MESSVQRILESTVVGITLTLTKDDAILLRDILGVLSRDEATKILKRPVGTELQRVFDLLYDVFPGRP